MTADQDILSDLIERIVKAVNHNSALPAEAVALLADLAERERARVVQDWRGCRVYVGISPTATHAGILRMHQRGERKQLIARHYGVSVRTVERVLAAAQ